MCFVFQSKANSVLNTVYSNCRDFFFFLNLAFPATSSPWKPLCELWLPWQDRRGQQSFTGMWCPALIVSRVRTPALGHVTVGGPTPLGPLSHLEPTVD